MAEDELLVSCRFYFEADGLTDKQILEVSGLSAESPAAGADKVMGSSKNAMNLRQAAPPKSNLLRLSSKLLLLLTKTFTNGTKIATKMLVVSRNGLQIGKPLRLLFTIKEEK